MRSRMGCPRSRQRYQAADRRLRTDAHPVAGMVISALIAFRGREWRSIHPPCAAIRMSLLARCVSLTAKAVCEGVSEDAAKRIVTLKKGAMAKNGLQMSLSYH
jgi:hypothetical protein